MFSVPPSDLLLRLGEYDLAEEEEPYLYQERRVQIVASHPQFDPRTFEYDLALLRFYEPVAFQPNIIPVCVPDSDENFIGRTAFVTGWGRLYEVFINIFLYFIAAVTYIYIYITTYVVVVLSVSSKNNRNNNSK